MGSDANDWLLAGVRPLRVDVPADDGEPVDTDVDERTAHLPYVLFRDVRPILASQWLIKGVLPRHGLAAIYGPSGEGKTFIALDLLMSIAGGAAWRGHRTTPGAVLYLAPDGGASSRTASPPIASTMALPATATSFSCRARWTCWGNWARVTSHASQT